MLHHIGFFKWNPYAPGGTRDHFIRELNKFPENDHEVSEWNAGQALTPAVWPRGDHFDYGLSCVLPDRDAVVRYNRSVWHQELIALVQPVRGWIMAWDFVVARQERPRAARPGEIRHHGFFKWNPEAPPAKVAAFIEALEQFPAQNSDVGDWTSGPGLEPAYWPGGDRWDYGLSCLLPDRAAVDRYNAHPWHQHLISLLPASVADVMGWDFVVQECPPPAGGAQQDA
ncbi:MAG: Dabb family protein [Dehalococcoidia bacterium]|nr:Dabb family protein [Dehalococcoidia bacterium]